MQNYKETINDCNKAIEIHPKYDVAYYMRAGAYYFLGNGKAVLLDCNKSIKINPDFADAY